MTKVRTFARVRCDDGLTKTTTRVSRDNSVVVSTGNNIHTFSFDGTFGRTEDQDQVFSEVVAPLVESAMSGIHGTLFAYGQTGSGKTYTITGGDNYETRGMIPRALTAVFGHEDMKVCKAYYLEIYNEMIFDLLDDRRKIQLYSLDEDETTTVHLPHLTVKQVESEEEALDLFFRGNMSRSVGATMLNQSSSRSHCVFCLQLETDTHAAHLNFVDLAGSERTQDHTSKNINLSLHFLEQVVMNIQHNQQHVSFRNSTMTSLLRESLYGNCQTSFLMMLNPEELHASESLSTCRFAQRCRRISTQAIVNESLEQKITRLEAENEKLQEELVAAKLLLEEHDQIRLMLNELLSSMDHDAEYEISQQISFAHNSVRVDLDSEVILVTTSFQKPTKIAHSDITSCERMKSDSKSIFRLLDKDEKILAEFEYCNDKHITWLQSFEHWLGTEVLETSLEMRNTKIKNGKQTTLWRTLTAVKRKILKS